MDTDNLKSGFKSWGIYLFNPDAFYSKLPKNVNSATENEHNISDSVLEYLKEICEVKNQLSQTESTYQWFQEKVSH